MSNRERYEAGKRFYKENPGFLIYNEVNGAPRDMAPMLKEFVEDFQLHIEKKRHIKRLITEKKLLKQKIQEAENTVVNRYASEENRKKATEFSVRWQRQLRDVKKQLAESPSPGEMQAAEEALEATAKSFYKQREKTTAQKVAQGADTVVGGLDRRVGQSAAEIMSKAPLMVPETIAAQQQAKKGQESNLDILKNSVDQERIDEDWQKPIDLEALQKEREQRRYELMQRMQDLPVIEVEEIKPVDKRQEAIMRARELQTKQSLPRPPQTQKIELEPLESSDSLKKVFGEQSRASLAMERQRKVEKQFEGLSSVQEKPSIMDYYNVGTFKKFRP